ncbi:MAG: hypothetical protein DRI89_00320 [Bacteroidetes bacterium]|nr:MAG: hypothetical protein DRI89_00320 [Bacteroidota bacterium]
MKFKIFLTATILASFLSTSAQYHSLGGQGDGPNVITTAVPFLMIGPDARAGGMGDGGVATSPDANSMHWNAAKFAFIDQKFGFAISYTPWLRNLVNDINLLYASYFNRIGDMQTIAFSLRYFTLGEITFTDNQGQVLGIFKPNEYAIDGTYARKLSEHLSIAVAARFIYSNLTQGQTVQGQETTAGISAAADIAMYWQKDVDWFKTMDAEFAWGINISNIGSKMSYSKSNIEKDFIPTNFRVGPRLTLLIDDYNKLSFNFDINKLLVPTPPIYALDSSGNPIPVPGSDKYEIEKGMDPDVPPIGGMVQSWYDAPYGFSEEMSEFNFAVGMEYWYNDIFALRGGFFWEDKNKGARRYATLGVGLRYNVFGLDFSYLIPVSSAQNPLQNTLRFSLIFNFGNVTQRVDPEG